MDLTVFVGPGDGPGKKGDVTHIKDMRGWCME